MSQLHDSSAIQDFYAGRSVLITGATGFLGKVLLEKLLRSCRDIEKIFLLIRPKKNKNVQERLDAIFDHVIFDVLKEQFVDYRKKIVGIAADIQLKGLGLSITDRTRIVDEVSMIFHVAATVLFDDRFDKTVYLNVNSVKDIIDLSRECKKLVVGVHVSTAYSNCIRKEIAEELYPPPLSFEEVNGILAIAENRNWSDETMELVAKGLKGEWPNVYTFTKVIAEGVVAEYAEDLPFGIFRPSIVTSTNTEPVPGWANSLFGINGLIAAMSLGVVHVIETNADAPLDLIPVDMTCNALIASAREIAVKKSTDKSIPVYNYVSGPENPITSRRIYQIGKDHQSQFPVYSAIAHPWVIFTNSKIVFVVLDVLFHLLPAILIDNIGRLFGRKPNLYRLYGKIHRAMDSFIFFAKQSWDFKNDNVQNLWNQLGTKDREIFPFSVRSIDWDTHTLNFFHGGLKWLLNESADPESRKRAVRKQFTLYAIHILMCLATAGLALWVLWCLFGILFRGNLEFSENN